MSICDNTEEGKRCLVHCGDSCNCQPTKKVDPKLEAINQATDALEMLMNHNPPKTAWEIQCYERIIKALINGVDV